MKHNSHIPLLMFLTIFSISSSAILDPDAMQIFQQRYETEHRKLALVTLRQAVVFADSQKPLTPEEQVTLMEQDPISTSRRLLTEHVNDVSTRANSALHASAAETIQIINLFIAYKGDNTNDQIVLQSGKYLRLLEQLREYLAITDKNAAQASIILQHMKKIIETISPNVYEDAMHLEQTPTREQLNLIIPLLLLARESLEKLYLISEPDGTFKYNGVFYAMSALNAVEGQCLEWYVSPINNKKAEQSMTSIRRIIRIGGLIEKYPKTFYFILFMMPIVLGAMPYMVADHMKPATTIYEPTSNKTILAGYVNNLTSCLIKPFVVDAKLGTLLMKKTLAACVNETQGWNRYLVDQSIATILIKHNVIFDVLTAITQVMISATAAQASIAQLQIYEAMLYGNLTQFTRTSPCIQDVRTIATNVNGTKAETNALLAYIIGVKNIATNMVSSLQRIILATRPIK